MSAVALLRLLLPLVLVIALLVALRRRTAGDRPTGRLAAVARITGGWRNTGLLIGLLLAAAAFELGALGRGVMLAAPLFGLCVLLGVVMGELRVSPPAGSTRSAVLEVRRARDYLPSKLTLAVGSVTGLLVVVLAMTTALGSADDLGRAGRSLARQCTAEMSQRTGPWPGSFYSFPLAVVLLAGLAVAAMAVHRVVRRPRQGEEQWVDDVLRRRAGTSVTAAVGLLVTVPLAGVSTFSARALLTICDPPLWWIFVGGTLALVAPLALALGVWCLTELLLPIRARTRSSAR